MYRVCIGVDAMRIPFDGDAPR